MRRSTSACWAVLDADRERKADGLCVRDPARETPRKMAQPLGRSKMKTLFGATLVAVLATCVAVPFVALGQQKTAKECRDEWRASTDAANGTQKDYVAKCRGEGAANG